MTKKQDFTLTLEVTFLEKPYGGRGQTDKKIDMYTKSLLDIQSKLKYKGLSYRSSHWRFFLKFLKIHRETPVPESLLYGALFSLCHTRVLIF